jgi:hypothetical protein
VVMTLAGADVPTRGGTIRTACSRNSLGYFNDLRRS